MRIPPFLTTRLNRASLFGSPSCRLFYSLLFIIICATGLQAEGSKDFINYSGYRMFLDTRDTQQVKVYAEVGEFINFGASHVGVQGGFIQVYRPDGTLATTLQGGGGSTGIIYNNTQEANGPVGAPNGYDPGVIQVQSGQAGVWTLYFGFPSYVPVDFPNILNNAAWTRDVDQPNVPRVILAWDVTISKNAAGNNGGAMQTGRVFTNELVTVINQNGFNTSPTFYVLTKDGFIYEVDFIDADPFRFPISSNSSGFLNSSLQPTYNSQQRQMVIRSDDPSTWQLGNYYLYEPQAEDYNGGSIINNKIFFNPPDQAMPGTALTTDVFRENTHTTWLYRDPIDLGVAINDFKVTAVGSSNDPCDAGFVQTGYGGQMVFESNVSGTASLYLDLNDNGIFIDPVDRVIFQQIVAGQNSIYWDGKDGQGVVIPPASDFILNYQLKIRGGETHILLTDVENNQGGVTFSLYNNISTPNPDIFYYDHSPINGPVSGSGTPGNPQATTVPFTYSSNFGNNKILDYWTFFEYSGSGDGVVTITISDDCNPTPVSPTGPDHDGDGIRDVVDIDDDNDGVPDRKEFCNPGGGFACLPGAVDPSHDEDEDGVLNYMDADDPAFPHTCPDTDNDGVCDILMPAFDKDADGVPDHYDLDSDNDGISDLVEAGHGMPDANADGVIDGDPSAFGDNGLYNPIASHPDALTATETYVRWDVDTDGVPDHDDLDSDNDGINDVAEAGYSNADTNNDGRIDNGTGFPPSVDDNGLAPLINPDVTGTGIPLPPDKDGDAIPDWHDLDSDNDLIHDVEEGGNPDPDNDAIIGMGIPTVDDNGKSFGLFGTTSQPLDTDNDNVRDFHDLDSDNDGINDVREANGIDPNNDGLPGTGSPSVNDQGIPTSDNAGNPLTPTSAPQDTDNDNVRDYRDLDSDNDGINDVAETNLPDPDNNGKVGTGSPAVNPNGQATGNPPTSAPTDTDMDGIPDFRELDADDDGITDVTEANLPDPDFNGLVGNGTPSVNLNGQASGNPPTSNPTDTDNDGTPDFQELDADDDGILDAEECPVNGPCIDGDMDGMADFQDPDRDNDGIADSYECETGFPCPDTDNDGTPDVDDLDTDGDGILDIDECSNGAPCPDANNNGIPEWREYFCNPAVTVPNAMNLTGDGNFCEGESTMLSATNFIDVAGETITYEWVGPNGFLFSQTTGETGPFMVTLSNLSTDNSGEYTLYLFTEEGCVGEPVSITVEVNAAPTTPTLSVENDEFCTGETLELNATNFTGPDVSYQWFFNNGNTQTMLATTTIPTYFVENLGIGNTGVYTVKILNGNCESQESNAQDVAVGTVFSQTPSLNVDEDVLCAGETLELNATPLSTGNVEYNWFFNDGSGPVSIATTSVPTLFIENTNALNTGVYNVSVQVGNCTSALSNSQNVDVDMVLGDIVPMLNIDEDFLCAGQSVELNSTAYAGTDVGYQWWFDNGNGVSLLATTDVPTYFVTDAQANNSGNYSVSIINGNCTSQLSNTQDVEVNNDLTGIIPVLSLNEDVLCEGQTLELNSTPFAGQNMQYEWYFNDGTGPVSLGTSEIPTWFVEDVSAVNEGIYTVTVTMGLCITQPSNAQDVEVTNDFSSATPALSVLEDHPCEGMTIELNSTVFSGGMVSYQWYFDNGVSSELVSTTSVPTLFIDNASSANSGQYNVVVNVGNCTTQASNTQDISVTDAVDDVAPTLSANQETLCEGETLELNSTQVSGSNVMYEWFFNNGTGQVSLGMTSVPTFFVGNLSAGNTGEYNVVALVGNCSTQQSNTQDLTVTDDLTSVTPELSVNQNQLCDGETLELNSSIITGGNVSYEWFFNSGSGMTSIGVTDAPTLFIDNVDFANSGIYEVAVSLGNCTSQPSNAESIIINNELDTAPALSVSQPALCEGSMLELNSTTITGSGVTFEWFFDDGTGMVSLGTTNVPTLFVEDVTLANSGMYQVVYAVGNCTSQPSNVESVTINNELDTTPALSVSQSVLCEGGMLELNSTTIAGNGVTYEWFFDDGTGSVSLGMTNVPTFFVEEVTLANSGMYQVVYAVGNCTSQPSNVESVTIDNELDTAPVLSIGDDVLCAGEMLELNSSMLQGADVEYQWYFNDGTGATLIATTDVPTFFIENTSGENTGVYTVLASNGNCVSQASNAQDLMVQAAPMLSIDNPTDELAKACPGSFIDLSVPLIPGATYQWSGPQGFSSNMNSPVVENVTALNAGDYYVQVETAGCSFTSPPATVHIFNSVKADDDNYEIRDEETVTSTDFLLNDFTGNIENWTLTVVESPMNGTLEEVEGEWVYTPRTGFLGVDVFKYEICNDECPDECAEAEVQVRVLGENQQDESCFVPNIITPNGDGANDAFRVPCLDNINRNNSLRIYNRWGDVVYQARPYRNDWEGTFQGSPLPPGTYFYLLQLDVTSEDCTQGYFTITR